MTKEPADWAKIKAYRAHWPNAGFSDEDILEYWPGFSKSLGELARMYDQYEKPPVDPDLLAAAEWYSESHHLLEAARVLEGVFDADYGVRGFLAGIKHGRANP